MQKPSLGSAPCQGFVATRGQAGACSARTNEIFVETLADFNEIRSRTFTRFLQHTEKQINELSFLNRKSIFVIMIRGKIRCSISIQFSPTPRISSERRDDFLDAASRGSAPRGGQKRVRVAAPATTICDKSISRFFDGFSATFFSQILLPSKQRGFRVLSTSTLTSYHPKECFSLLHSTLLKGRRARARVRSLIMKRK